MTTEDDFHRALNKRPSDFSCRLVFADFLQERGDPRAEGYRALGVNRRMPLPGRQNGPWRFLWSSAEVVEVSATRHVLPADWFAGVMPPLGDAEWSPFSGPGRYALTEYETRREAEDKVALAFALLPAERRAELLNPKGAPA